MAAVPVGSGSEGAPAERHQRDWELLARDRRRIEVDVSRTVVSDRPQRGAIAVRVDARTVRRAEPGPCGPLVLEARGGDELTLEVWGPRATPEEVVERALADAAAWAGCDDEFSGFAEIVACNTVLRRLLRRVGTVRLSRLPRVGEALGRAVLQQLVQAVEGRRSVADVAALVGEPAAGSLWCWPTATSLGATPAWSLRPCGVSLRGARALHAGATADRRLRDAVGDWRLLDRRLLSLPGVGPWTSAETRLAMGDPDAVSVGDYNLPALVGHVLGGGGRDGGGAGGMWDDAAMLELLAPFAGHRGRVLRLIELGLARRLVARPARRAPRAALSRHRRW